MDNQKFNQKSAQIWDITYIKLCELKNKTGIPIIKLINSGVLLLEKEYKKNVRRERESEGTE